MQSGTRLGPYEIVAAIGAGGMGEVYKARDTRLGRDVAIKVLPADLADDAERLKRFEREAKATAALSHPNILAVHDVGTFDGVPYLVEELLEGESLRERLSRGAIPVAEVVEIAIQVAHGLAAAHAKHIVHRDLKPANLFLTSEGTVKILDFGLAKLVEGLPPGEADTLTHAPTDATGFGRVLGTMAYMAPEQARGVAVDERADIFAFGVVLYEMLAGERPFRGETATDTVAAILKEEPPSLPTDVPSALQSVVTQCLAKRPDQRFSSGHDLELALLAASSQGETPHPTRARPGFPGLARQRRMLLAGGVLFIGAIVGALAIWRPWRPVSRPAGPVAERIPSILALPCKVYGAPEEAFLTDAVPGTVSTLLAGVPGIDTKVPPTSLEVDRLKGDLAKIAGAFQVENLLLTTITANGDRLVLNAQVVEAGTRRVRWGKQYEGLRRDFNELARQAAEGVRDAVSPVSAPVPTARVSGEAELACREGKYFLNRYRSRLQEADFNLALKAFTMALERDPTFARAAGEIARLYLTRFSTVSEGEKNQELRRIESWARRAVDLDPRCGEAWGALSSVAALSSNLKGQVEYGLKAVRYAPRDPSVHLALVQALAAPGSDSCSLAAAQRAWEVDPLQPQVAAQWASTLLALGKTHDALGVLDRALALEPDATILLPMKARALTNLGRFAEAADMLRRCEPPPTEVARLEHWDMDRFALALAEDDKATVRSLEGPVFKIVSGERSVFCAYCYLTRASYVIAPRLAHIGRKDEALKILLRMVEAGVAPSYDWLLREPDIQLLRGDPRFAKVLAASRDGAALVARLLREAQTRGELPAYLDQPLDDLAKLLNEKGGTS